MKSVVLTFALAVAALSQSVGYANAQEPSLQTMLSARKLNVCWINYPPGGYIEASTGERKGYYFDILESILNQIDVEPVYVQTAWKTFVAALQSKKCDISIAGTLMTIPRAAVVSFSRPLFYLSSHLVAKKGESRARSVDELRKLSDVTIASVQGTSAHEFARLNFPEANIRALDSRNPTSPMLEIVSNRADYAVVDAWLAEKFAKEHPESIQILTIGQTFNAEGVGWVFRKEDMQLREFFDVALEKLRLTGKIAEHVRKYPESGRFILDERIRPVQ